MVSYRSLFLTLRVTIIAYFFLAKVANFISPELLIVSENPSYGASYIEVQHFEDWKLLKIVWPIRRPNAFIFIVYYQTINQKDKLLYIDMGKSMSFSLSTKTEI